MKTVTSTTSNIAWFKLADFVARGEKERALSVLRLLMHSVSNEALTYQLEGDILLAFNDLAAIQKYQNAAQLFKKSNQQHQAINAYQQALQIQEETESLQNLLELYIVINHKVGIGNTFARICKKLLEKQDFFVLQTILEQIIATTDQSLHFLLYSKLTISLLLYDVDNNLIHQYFQKSLDLYKSYPNYLQEFKKFSIDIKTLSPMLFKKMESLL